MKKLIINLTLILGFSLFTGGCGYYPVEPPPTSWHYVSGVLTERDGDRPIWGMEVFAWECKICFHDLNEDDCPEDPFTSAKTNIDGTFSFRYYGPSKFAFSHYHPSNSKYNHFSVNGINSDSILGPLCVDVEDSVFLDVKLW